MAAQRKRFRIETHPSPGYSRAADNEQAYQVQPVDMEYDSGAASSRHEEVMQAIRKLEDAVKPAESVSREILTDYTNQIHEVRQLKAELDQVDQAIRRTKQEIATLHANGFQDRSNLRAADHLDEVVLGTEQATTSILSAAEEIDQMAAMMQASLKDTPEAEQAEDIQLQVVKIFEACNFQDLTGQRITKVCDAFRYIEERVLHMIELWGGIEAFKGIEPDQMPEREGDRAMLDGPALKDADDQASQSDIDALFD